MRPFYKLVLLSVLVLFINQVKAQYFGGNPPSIRWDQVNTPAARVIFPLGMDSAAIRVANVIRFMNTSIQPTIGFKQKQISIVLQNQTTVSNAYVGLAPFRSEFYLTPDQNSFELGTLHWTDQLAIHEFRHVQQFNNFNVGVSHLLRIPFGEGGQAVANELSIPNWFFEGDAVYNETNVSDQGRGRLPYYFDGYRALWAAGKNYSWMKLRNGSYRDYTPDHYPLGYMLVAYGREKYGDGFWKNVTHDAAAYNGLFYPLQKAIRNYSHQDFATFRTEALDHFKKEYGLTAPAAGQQMKSNQHFIADQEYPAYTEDGTLLYVKTTYDHPPVFVKVESGKEKVIRARDFMLDNYFACKNEKIIYVSYRPDLRWAYRDYSELNMIDVKTGKETRITKSTKYFTPDLNADGSNIVAVNVDPSGKSELHILDVTGKVITVIPNPDHLFYTYPKFYGNQVVAAVRRVDGKMSLAMINVGTGKADYLLPFSIQPIGFPVIRDDKLYFTATTGKYDELFELSLTDKKLYKLTNDSLKNSIGNYQPAIGNCKIAWVGFTAYGYKVYQADTTSITKQQILQTALPGSLDDMGITSLSKGGAANLLSSVVNPPQPVSKYPKAFHLFNFHSLEPVFSDPNYSVSLLGENVLNTLQTSLLFNYNTNEGYTEYGFETVYGSLFPYLSAGVDYIVNRKISGPSVYYNEIQVHGGFEVPLNLSRGLHVTSLIFGTDLVYSRDYFSGRYDLPANSRQLYYLNNYISFSNHSRQAKKNIYPQFGQSLTLTYKSAINGVNAQKGLVTGNLIFPGLLANHNLVLTGAYQIRGDDGNAGRYSNDFPFARGYQSEDFYQMFKAGANYHFPAAYPDAGFGNILFLQRVRGNLFYDYSYVYDRTLLLLYTLGQSKDAYYRSAGTEVYFDAQLWNEFPISFGLRYSHLFDKDIFRSSNSNFQIDFIVPLSLFNNSFHNK